ncbi:hypothetical protein ACOME3_005285 [Neoechinorhynchus agilis]
MAIFVASVLVLSLKVLAFPTFCSNKSESANCSRVMMITDEKNFKNNFIVNRQLEKVTIINKVEGKEGIGNQNQSKEDFKSTQVFRKSLVENLTINVYNFHMDQMKNFLLEMIKVFDEIVKSVYAKMNCFTQIKSLFGATAGGDNEYFLEFDNTNLNFSYIF